MSSCWTPQGELRPHFSALFNQLEAIHASLGTQLNPSFPLSPDQQLSYSTFGKSLGDEQKPINVSMEAMTLGRRGGESMHGKAAPPPIRVAIRGEESPATPPGDPFLSPQDDHVSVTFSVLSEDMVGEEGGGSDEEDGKGSSCQELEATVVPSSVPLDAERVIDSSSSTPVAPKRNASSDQYSLSSSASGRNKQQPLVIPKQGTFQMPMVQLEDLGSRFDSSSTLTTISPMPFLQDSCKTSFFGGSAATPPVVQSSQHLGTRGGASASSSVAAKATNCYLSSPLTPRHPSSTFLQGQNEEAKLRGVSPLSATHRLSSEQDRLSGIEGGGSKSTDSGIRSGDETGGSVTPTPSGDDRDRTPTPSGGDRESRSGGSSKLSRNSYGLDSGVTDMTNDIMANFAKKMVSLRSN